MGLGIGKIEPAKNTSALIADALRTAILQGKLTSGQALRQDEIAAEFSVSKIPVREALVQLQAEGLVNLIPSRGAIVSRLSFSEIDEIYVMRIALEPIALRRAVPHLTASDFLQINAVLDQIDATEDLTRWAELNWAFHAALYRPAQMPRLLQTLQQLHNNVIYLFVRRLTPEYLVQSQRQHRELVALCEAGDIDEACACLEHHLGDPVRKFEDLLASVEE
jgi:DNA-binding GntR family transcriptional regulator